MSVTNNTYLPSFEDLYVPPLNLTSPVLKAGAIHFGLYCKKQSNVTYYFFFTLHELIYFKINNSKEFMLCSQEEADPRKCLQYNKELSNCATEFFSKVKDNCAESFTKYWQCIDSDHRGQLSLER